MRIALITEAWHPQVNGVVTTWSHVTGRLEAAGHEVRVFHAGLFPGVPAPRYPSIRIAVNPGRGLRRMLDEYAPEAIHVATEGPLGLAGRRYCLRRRFPFTTSYHTQFPEYLRKYYAFPASISYAFLRRFHAPAERTLVATPSMRQRLEARGFEHVVTWCRGVDTEVFRPGDKSLLPDPRPIFICAGRVAVEKNIEAFLSADLPGTKVIVGDGPALPRMRKRYPKARFLGYHPHESLARVLAAADVFVFPSRTDTFGVVMLEAMACGLPVAAYPVTGPIDVVKPGKTGVLDEDLRAAALAALKIDPAACRAEAERFTWDACAQVVLDNLAVTSG